MAIDAVQKMIAELMGTLTYVGLKKGLEVDDLLEDLVTWLDKYSERLDRSKK